MEDAINTVMSQCEMWTDNEVSFSEAPVIYPMGGGREDLSPLIAAEQGTKYNGC